LKRSAYLAPVNHDRPSGRAGPDAIVAKDDPERPPPLFDLAPVSRRRHGGSPSGKVLGVERVQAEDLGEPHGAGEGHAGAGEPQALHLEELQQRAALDMGQSDKVLAVALKLELVSIGLLGYT
jgi:hypothetical protein